jgi:ketosteroid isomerase-like protein
MDVVDGYLDALARRDWNALHDVLAPDVVRHGPYGDDFADRDTYVAFLAETLVSLVDYELDIERSFGDDGRVCVELAETATVGGRRSRTEEAVVFGIADGLVTEVRVFLQRSTPVD